MAKSPRGETDVIADSGPAAAHTSEMALVRRALNGDADAFASLFHLHKHRVYAVCLRMTNNTAEADDLTQDVFIQVFRKLSTFRGESALSTWLYRLAVNTALMHFRKQAPRQVWLDANTATAMLASVLLWTELRLRARWKLFRSVTELFLSCTRSKAMDIEKSRNSSAVRSGIQNHSCTRRNSEFANFFFPGASARSTCRMQQPSKPQSRERPFRTRAMPSPIRVQIHGLVVSSSSRFHKRPNRFWYSGLRPNAWLRQPCNREKTSWKWEH